MKKCPKCNKIKNKNEFDKNKSRKDGLSSYCKICLKEARKKHYSINKEHINASAKSYYKKHREYIIKKVAEYRQTPKGKEVGKKSKNKYEKKWRKKQRETNPLFTLIECLRGRINKTIQLNRKSARTIELLGCSIELFKQHIELQFTKGMTWQNHKRSGWHIDHIKPCSSFDLSKPEEQRKCFHYSNLQPLWAIDNLKKSDKICKELN